MKRREDGIEMYTAPPLPLGDEQFEKEILEKVESVVMMDEGNSNTAPLPLSLEMHEKEVLVEVS